MRISAILRHDNSGLGSMSVELAEHIELEKILLVGNGAYKTFFERFRKYKDVRESGRDIARENLDWLLTDVDIILCIETPYNWNVYNLARARNVKVVMIPMYEGMKPNVAPPDLYLCVSKLDYDEFPEPKVYIPWPVNRQKIPYRKREKAVRFLHNAGHGGLFGRNGTNELLQAIPMVKSDVKFIINSQTPLEVPNDPRIDLRVGNKLNYQDMWTEGDVFVFPEKFNALSLPINEALAAGMPIIATNRYPFNTFLPKELLVDVAAEHWVKISRKVKLSIPSVQDIARKIDFIANKDISALSEASNELAKEISWDSLNQKYKEILCTI